MLRETTVESEPSATWAFDTASTTGRGSQPDWRTVDRELRKIACRRAALDAEEARWLREAERCQLWRHLGMVSALDYMERVLGYAPRTAQDRLRVALALGEMPVLNRALASGQLPFSAIRELSRVATPRTEAEWCEAATGKNLRQIEELVADHKPGARPDDPPDPRARMHVLRFEVSAETFARLRQASRALDDERGTHSSDDELIAALCDAVLDKHTPSEPHSRAKYQIAMILCEKCKQGWQQAAGARIAVGANVVERAMCDAQQIGSLEGPAPTRATQDVPPNVMRFVWRRDGGRCRVPGCRSSRGLEVHHLIHREAGGSHEPANLVLLCSSCHAAHHDGRLRLRGTADQLHVERPADPTTDRAHVGADLRAQARDALAGLGWKPATAAAAVDAALVQLADDAPLETLIREALRRCPTARPASRPASSHRPGRATA